MLLTVCQNTFQSMVELEEVDSLRVEVRECYAEITRTSEQIQSTVRENYLSKDDLTTIQQDFQTAITQAASEIRMDFTTLTNEITNNVSGNYSLIEEYIRFRGALIELGKVGNAFTCPFWRTARPLLTSQTSPSSLPTLRSVTGSPLARQQGAGLILSPVRPGTCQFNGAIPRHKEDSLWHRATAVALR